MTRPNTARGVAFLGVGLAGLLMLGAPPRVRGQISPDPYKPYNAQYEQYIYPSFPGSSGVAPNQYMLDAPTGLRAANQFQRYLEDVEGDREYDPSRKGATTPRREIGVPSSRAYRQLDREYKRLYRPNEDVDQQYNNGRKARDDKYSEYLAAKTPVERAKLRKEFEKYQTKTLRDLDEGRRASAASTARRTSAPELPDLTAPASPARRRLPNIKTPAPATPPATGATANVLGGGLSSGTTTPRRGSTDRTPSDTLRRSENMDREPRRPSNANAPR